MKPTSRRADPSGDRDGVRIVYDERKGRRSDLRGVAVAVLLSALAAVLLLGGWLDRGVREPGERGVGEREAPYTVRRAPPPANRGAVRSDEAERLARSHATIGGQTTADVAPGSSGPEHAPVPDQGSRREVAARDYIAKLRESGETGGLAAFPLPGTRPLRPGIIVPPDYQLPEGFARHYQTTDDGRQLDPILVIAPGYEIVDDEGEPVALTDNRIVPPEYAPTDLPVQLLEVPAEQGVGENGP